MKKGEQTRARIVETATQLFQQQGYAATGLTQVLAESGSPRGSLYHHFPRGKEGLALAVIATHARDFGQLLEAMTQQAPNAVAAAAMVVEALATQLEGSGCRSGCPVTAIALEMSSISEPLRLATRAAYEGWVDQISVRLVEDGAAPEPARVTARALLGAIEGALIMSRAYGDRGPLDDLKASLPRWLAP